MNNSLKRFANRYIWFRRSLKVNKRIKAILESQLEKCKDRAFSHGSWTEDEYIKCEAALNTKIRELDDMRQKSINHGAN